MEEFNMKDLKDEIKNIEKALDRTTKIHKIIKLSIRWFELIIAIEDKINAARKRRKPKKLSYINTRNPFKPESSMDFLKRYKIIDHYE